MEMDCAAGLLCRASCLGMLFFLGVVYMSLSFDETTDAMNVIMTTREAGIVD